MNQYSKASLDKLNTCDERLQALFARVLEICDHTIIVGHRTHEKQEEAYRTGHSKLRWPNSPHNAVPSRGVDAAPYPIDWNDRERFTLFAGLVLGVAEQMGVRVRWGGDWDRDWQVKDNGFDDLVHFELIE